MISNIIWLLIKLSCVFYCVESAYIEEQVTVAQGVLEGFYSETNNDFGYYSYLGIPYATPPVGNLRFQDPQPALNWEGIYNASSYGSHCSRLDTTYFTGGDDCLFLNIFVPNATNTDNKLPVMFWIHGGGFYWGDGGASFYGPQYIIEKDVILVTINYRLGALGFMSVFNNENHGNMGIKDQLVALKWVNDNIGAFGGDSEKITLFGESGGGMSIEMLILSESSQGLFKRAIDMSGPILFEGFFKDNNPEKYAFAIGSELGLDTEDPDELLEYLKSLPAENITRAAKSVEIAFGEGIIFVPTIEKESSPNPILTKHPRDILTNRDFNPVDEIMYGTVSQEGILDLESIMESDIDWDNASVDELVPDFKKFIPYDIDVLLDDTKREKAISLIRDFYFSNNQTPLENFIDLQSDIYFNRHLQFSFKHVLTKAESAFYYKFSYNGVLNLVQYLIPFSYSEAAHSDELGYIFTGIYSNYGDPTEQDWLIVDRMVKMWTNFAKYGNPTPEITDNLDVVWNAANETNFFYLEINDKLTLGENPFEERIKFWDDLPDVLNNSSAYGPLGGLIVAMYFILNYLK